MELENYIFKLESDNKDLKDEIRDLKLKLARKKVAKRRSRWGTPKPINEPFEGGVFHHFHINDHKEGAYIPEQMHKDKWHSYKNGKSMNRINRNVLLWLIDTEQIPISYLTRYNIFKR